MSHMSASTPLPPSALQPPLTGEHGLIDLPGGAVAFYHAGPPHESSSDAARPVPLLLIHSVNAAASAFEVRPLYEHYRHERPVYAIDLPGYGLSDRSERAYSPRLMTDAVLALQDVIASRHGDTAIDAIAVSLGCEYLARAAVERTTAFRSVALVSATALNRSRPFYGPPGSTRGQAWLLALLGRAPWSAALFRLLTKRSVVRFFLEKTWGSKDIDEALLEYDLLTTRVPGAANAPFYFLSAFLFSADISRIYERIAAPVLLVHGTKGDFVDYRDAPRLARDFGWHIDVMQSGAMPYFEDLAGFVERYEAFLNGEVIGTR